MCESHPGPHMTTLFITHPASLNHLNGTGHPERPERADVFTAVAESFAARGGQVREPRPATREELARVHTSTYLDEIETSSVPDPVARVNALLSGLLAIEAAALRVVNMPIGSSLLAVAIKP